jgi:hypothetical protein
MRKPRSALALLLLLGLGVFLVVPAEDVPETPYDESESLPYEDTPVFSIGIPLLSARTTEAVRSPFRQRGEVRADRSEQPVGSLVDRLVSLGHPLRC